MSNYELIKNKEFAYLYYLVTEFRKLENDVERYLSDRNVKLDLLLKDDYCKAIDSLKESIQESIYKIDAFDIHNLDAKELEDVSAYINDVGKYFEYIQSIKIEIDSKLKKKRDYLFLKIKAIATNIS